MNNLINIDHINQKVGDGKGLSVPEMIIILEKSGARCFVADFINKSQIPILFQKYIYGSVESGFPVIVIFKTSQSNGYHAIPVFGHTFNEDTWVPRADISYFRIGPGTRYIPSESWLSMFIAHDDNWGSNFCIPRRYLHANALCSFMKKNQIKDCPIETAEVASVITTVPKEVKMSPIRAEAIGVDYLFTIMKQMPSIASKWEKRLLNYANSDMLVIRPILKKKNNYLNHLKQITGWDKKKINKNLIKALDNFLNDEFFWVIELSVPELFSANRRKMGEVLIRSNIEPKTCRDMDSFVLARLPGFFVLYKKGGAKNPNFSFIPSGIDSHVELLI